MSTPNDGKKKPADEPKEPWHGFWDEEDGDGKPEREPWRGDEWIPAEEKWSEMLCDRLPQPLPASLIHFEKAWGQMRIAKAHRKLSPRAEHEPPGDWSERELARLVPAMLEAMENGTKPSSVTWPAFQEPSFDRTTGRMESASGKRLLNCQKSSAKTPTAPK